MNNWINEYVYMYVYNCIHTQTYTQTHTQTRIVLSVLHCNFDSLWRWSPMGLAQPRYAGELDLGGSAGSWLSGGSSWRFRCFAGSEPVPGGSAHVWHSFNFNFAFEVCCSGAMHRHIHMALVLNQVAPIFSNPFFLLEMPIDGPKFPLVGDLIEGFGYPFNNK